MQGQGKKGHVVDSAKFQLMRESSTEKMVKAVIKCLPTGKKRELRVDLLDTPSFKKWERLRRVTQY